MPVSGSTCFVPLERMFFDDIQNGGEGDMKRLDFDRNDD